MAKTMETAISMAQQILNDFPLSQVIIEEFLPSDDITCGFLKLGKQVLLLPTYYLIKSVSGRKHILDRTQRLRSWDDVDKMQPVITDNLILNQLKQHLPSIIETLDIQDFTRIDGRLNQEGKLHFFDINGMPALDFPDSVMNKQCFSCFPDYPQKTIYTALLHTIVQNALLRYEMNIPEAMKTHNLFTLKSNFVIQI
ncbi:MAG: hypothetical protein HC803_03635 [Saprospiraceae bacterium]|nr:hypothetical protein [Saprospiraceae bacterium]